MKKDFARDYIVEAFRLYARTCSTITEDNPTPALLDIMAVQQTLAQLQQSRKQYIVQAIEAIYFPAPSVPLHKGDISARVIRFCYEYHASERSVYLWLREARHLCATKRGLRI